MIPKELFLASLLNHNEMLKQDIIRGYYDKEKSFYYQIELKEGDNSYEGFFGRYELKRFKFSLPLSKGRYPQLDKCYQEYLDDYDEAKQLLISELLKSRAFSLDDSIEEILSKLKSINLLSDDEIHQNLFMKKMYEKDKLEASDAS